MSISITRPIAGATVHSPFTVNGDYDTGGGGGTISVTVYQSDGTTPLPNTMVVPAGIMIPTNKPIGTWSVSVSRNGAYNGAIITATLTPTGGNPQPDSVTGIDIS